MTPSASAHPNLYTLGLILIGLATLLSLPATNDESRVLNCPAYETTAIRLFYNLGANSVRDYFHGPLTFRRVEPGDPRLDTAPLEPHEGRMVYVSGDETVQLVQTLTRMDLSWKWSQELVSLDPSITPLPDNENMDVLIVCSKGGGATGKVPAKRICATLKPLDRVFTSPRALWEFQLYRQGFGCKVPGFDYKAYPDHSN
jgi:hypothetical protein